jgi:steroid delta-isomerase-like uncharacterized protein
MNRPSNTSIVRPMIMDIWNRHDPGAAGRHMTPELAAESAEHVRQFLVAFPDSGVTVEDIFGERDRVVARLTVRGTHHGPFAGHPPTGRPIDLVSIRIYRLEDGRVAETWAMQDRLGPMQQLGLVQETGPVARAGGPGPEASGSRSER